MLRILPSTCLGEGPHTEVTREGRNVSSRVLSDRLVAEFPRVNQRCLLFRQVVGDDAHAVNTQ
jgi:hypothetical protein